MKGYSTSLQRSRMRARPDQGAAVVEFVIVLSLLVFLLFSVVDMAMLMHSQLVLAHAAREGARRAAIDGGLTAKVRERIFTQLELGGLDVDRVEMYMSPYSAPYGWSIRLRLTYRYRPLSPPISAVWGSAIPITAEFITRSERIE